MLVIFQWRSLFSSALIYVDIQESREGIQINTYWLKIEPKTLDTRGKYIELIEKHSDYVVMHKPLQGSVSSFDHCRPFSRAPSHINTKSRNFVVLRTASWCQPARNVQLSKEKDILIISQLWSPSYWHAEKETLAFNNRASFHAKIAEAFKK